MSEKLRFLQFNEEYLNSLHKDTIRELDEKDITCYKCGKPFKRGQWFVRKIRNSSTGNAKRHVICAVQVNLITERQAKKYLTCFGMVAVAGWAFSVAQVYLLGTL